MAETNSSLGFNSKLQIVIVPKGTNYVTPDNKTGKLIFREGTNIIEVNGHEYQAAKTGDLSKITEALKNTGYLTESNGVLTAEAPGTVADLLGTKISTAASENQKTVSAWIDDILGKISGINVNISSLQKATETNGTGNFVVRDKSGEGKTDFANTTAIQTAINNAKNAAIDAAKEDAAKKDTKVKTDLIGTGTTSESTTDPLKVELGKTWAQNEAKTLSSLKDLILKLKSQLNTLTETDLDKVNNAIKAIEQELTDGSSGLTTIIDGLKVFLGSGLTTTGASYTVNGKTCTTLQQIITELETEIKARIASVNKRSGETYIDVTTDSNKNVTVSSTQDLKTAVTNANSAIQSVNKGSNDSLISVSTTDKNVTVSSTQALKTAVTNANAAFPKGESKYNDAAALESGLKGNLSDDTANSATIAGAKKYADSKSDAAKTAAEATALSYANNVITWTVIS